MILSIKVAIYLLVKVHTLDSYLNLSLINLTLSLIPDSPRAKITVLTIVYTPPQTVEFPLHDEHKEQLRTGKEEAMVSTAYI